MYCCELELYPLNETDCKSLQYHVNDVLTKIFGAKSSYIGLNGQQAFDCVISDRIARRKPTFLSNLIYRSSICYDAIFANYEQLRYIGGNEKLLYKPDNLFVIIRYLIISKTISY